MPVFAATMFHAVWWQILIAAAVGSALGQLAVRYARSRIARGAVIAAALIVIGATVAWTFRRGGSAEPKGESFLVVRSPSLTWDDVEQIRTVQAVKLVVPYLQSSEQTASEDQNWNTSVVGTTSDYFEFMHLQLAHGTGFVPGTAKIVVVGETVAKQLFGANDPVGQTVRIHSYPYQIVGLLAHRGTAPSGQDLDDVVLMPLEIFQQKIKGGLARLVGGSILISPYLPDDLPRVEEGVRSVLRDRHHLVDGDDGDVTIHTVNR